MPKVLVANRGEIAVRILRTINELGWTSVALYTDHDASHASFADETVQLQTVADFLNVEAIVRIAERTRCTHLHPGYGFLSEHPQLAQALANSSSTIFVGPSLETLRIASNKILSRELAASLRVNVAPGTRASSITDVHAFGEKVGYPVMIKALDGGGGRGIRIVERREDVAEAFKRCVGESPSRRVFVEKALINGQWRHVEVQIIGDGTGAVNHFWERECSVQRRFQKMIEIAPSRLPRTIVQPLINASMTIAEHLKYKGLGTFEFLVNAQTHNWVFMEINPRVQVEHTITEEIMDIDLIRAQLLIFTPSTTLDSLSLKAPLSFPTKHAIQLRLTAEDPTRNFLLSPGKIRRSDLTWPAGPGIRIDTWLCSGFGTVTTVKDWTVGTDLDSLLAKLVVRGRTFEEASQRARRALLEFNIGGDVKTNIAVLVGVLEHQDWAFGSVDALWLERNLEDVTRLGNNMIAERYNTRTSLAEAVATNDRQATNVGRGDGSVIIQPGTLFHLEFSPTNDTSVHTKHTLSPISLAHNNFPNKLSGTLQSTLSSTPLIFSLTQSAGTSVLSTTAFELADPNDPSHIPSPLNGKIVELHPALAARMSSSEPGNETQGRVRKGETLVVLSVMKMENAVVSPVEGIVKRLGKGVRVGEVLGEGVLLCVVSSAPGRFISKL